MAETDAENESLRREAEALLEQLPLMAEWHKRQQAEGENARAFIVEFAGMPKAGKSTAIENLRHYFSHGHKVIAKFSQTPKKSANELRYRIHTPAEGVSLRTPQQLKSDWTDYNAWAGAYGLQELLQAGHDDHHDLVVLDRGPWDASCWLDYWQNQAAPENGDQIAGFFRLNNWIVRSDLHVVLVVDPAHAAQREKDDRLIEHAGFASNSVAMAAMRAIYEDKFQDLLAAKSQSCPHVGNASALKLDTTGIPSRRVAIEIIKAIFEVLNRKLAYKPQEFVFTAEWLLERVEAYQTHVRGKRVALRSALKGFSKKANELPLKQRLELSQRIEAKRAPDFILSARSTSSKEEENQIIKLLNDELEQVRGK